MAPQLGYETAHTAQLKVHKPTNGDVKNFDPSKLVLKACENDNALWLLGLLKTILPDSVTTVNFQSLNKKDQVNVDLCDDDSWTGLHWASRHNNCQILSALLRAGADVNKLTRTGDTALSLAVLYGNTEVAMMLLQSKNCDVNITSKDGKTALMHACRFNHEALAVALLAAGASTRMRTSRGDDCLSLACQNGHHNIVKLLVNAEAIMFENSLEFEHALESSRDDETKTLLTGEVRWFLRKSFLMTMLEGGVVGPSSKELREAAAKQNAQPKTTTLEEAVFCNLYREIALFL
mmetsp:Transcript_10018/g.16629  ORF Transcript_10018/g.16629 Transcript_10018/m.16629 type:complete len:292 (-) Transcript_10018:196-1071(-)